MKNYGEASTPLPAGMSREKQLRLLAKQLKVRGQAAGKKLTFVAVAEAAGVSTALIHNHYPDVAEYIRELQGKSSRAQRNAKHGTEIAMRAVDIVRRGAIAASVLCTGPFAAGGVVQSAQAPYAALSRRSRPSAVSQHPRPVAKQERSR